MTRIRKLLVNGLLLCVLPALILIACSEGGNGDAKKDENGAPVTGLEVKQEVSAAEPVAEEEVEQNAPAATAVAPIAITLPDPSTTWCGDTDCPCKEGSENLHYQAETIQKCKLLEATVIQGVYCMEADVTFMPEGNLARCYLSQDQQIGPYSCSKQRQIEFYRDGHFRNCELAEMAEFNGLWCKGITRFEADGSLHGCTIGQESELQGYSIPAGDWVTLDEGKLYTWEIFDHPQTFGQISCRGTRNYFHPDASLARCKLAQSTTIEGQDFAAEEAVCFDTEGALLDCKTVNFRTM